MRPFLTAMLGLAAVAMLSAQTPQHPRDGEVHDADTRAWWQVTEALSNDSSMQGRDTGTAAYRRAADLVAKRFPAAALKPAGEHGISFQTVPMDQLDLTPEGTSFTVARNDATVANGPERSHALPGSPFAPSN